MWLFQSAYIILTKVNSYIFVHTSKALHEHGISSLLTHSENKTVYSENDRFRDSTEDSDLHEHVL